MRYICAVVALVASPVAAGDWQALDGEGIREALTDRAVVYEGAWQRFYASGRTLYNAGQDSWGTWDVRGEQYCSQWPPNSAWSCYDVDVSADGSAVRFRGFGDDVSVGRFEEDR